MSAALVVGVCGIGVWTPAAPSWPALQALLAGIEPEPQTAPAAQILAPGERRRVPLSVRLAVEAAAQAIAASGLDATTMASVFASAYGDSTITDELARTLASAPTQVSPTRFTHSVLNAAAGHWSMAAACHAPSSAVCAGDSTFAAGLLEAALQVIDGDRPLLFVASDIATIGPLAEVTPATFSFACALVLAPLPADAPRLRLRTRAAKARESLPRQVQAAAWYKQNPCARSLGLLEALARGAPSRLRLALAPALTLDIEIEA
ncbi:MAG TPA: beta-ketoacyl synthase chain length factor [Rhodanobacteraceae bacterium]|nr:beta-ketoacyl synthase chain length factor [Rhodanobacteraceae bacterium]